MPTLNFDPSHLGPRPSFDALPDVAAIRELKSKHQWVAWRYKEMIDKDGKLKWTKPPVCPHNNFGASVSNPKTWGSYGQAVAKAVQANLAGVGYVLTEQDDFSGADLDHVRDAVTGDLDPWVRQIIDLKETYVEVSPSGEGLRILWRGKVSATFKHDPAQVEVYRSQRYLTITGEHLDGSPTEILPAPQTEALLRARVVSFKAQLEPDLVPINEPIFATANPSSSERPSEFFRRVNAAALAALPSWVPSIFSDAKYQSGTKAFRVSSKSLNRDLEEDLSIAPNGIVDFGVADMGDGRQGKRTAIDLVIDYGGAPDAITAAKWLCDRIGQTPKSLGWDSDDGRGAELAAQLLAGAHEVLDAPIETPSAVLDDLAFGPPTDWARPQGLLADMAEWILQSSRRPNRPLAVASAVATLSAICGRHLYGPTGTALNLYIACLAGTSVGKNRPLSAVAELMAAAKLPNLHTTAKGFSVSAVEQMVVDHPCCVATSDEIGVNLLGRMSHKNSNTHEMAMRGALLELWSREQGMAPFSTHRRATAASVEVPNPSLSIFGVSTPEAFYGAVTSGSVKDGFLNRFLIAQAAPRAKPVEVSEQARAVPGRISGALLDIVPPGEGNVGRAMGVFSLHGAVTAKRVPWADRQVRESAEAFEEKILALMDGNPDQAPLLGRVYEYSVRLATLHAVSRAGRAAAVTMADMNWGASWAMQSARTMIDGVLSLMATNDYEQKFNAIRNAIEQAGWLSKYNLLRKVRHITARERDEIVKHLTEGGWIRLSQQASKGGRPAVGWQWVG